MTIKARIFRGEVRTAFPTHTHPDPSEHLAADPHGFFKKWMEPNYPWPENWQGLGHVTTGQHWSRSPEAMPERFTEGVWNEEQTGVAMGKREATAVGRRQWLDDAHLHEPKFPRWSESMSSEENQARWEAHDVAKAEHHAMIAKYEKYVERAEREGINTYGDLSGGDPDQPGKAQPFRMGVIWEAHHPEEHEYEPGTSHEDELNLHKGVAARVTGARLFIPKTGVTQSITGERHPSVFSPEEHLAASLDMLHRSAISGLRKSSVVPWNRIQFPEPINVPIEGRKYWNR